MIYELAKKLKDAGFPQTWPQPDFLELHDALEVQKIYDKYPAPHVFLSPTKGFINGKPEPVLSSELAYAPTLSELIEACGDRFEGLKPDRVGTSPWIAMGYSEKGYQMCGASTPEEAVANLYLALHSK